MKKWYLSKTLWANLIAAIGTFTAAQFGIEISAEMVVTILTVLNVILRAITKEGLTV
jgi:hypothetical protein